MPMYLVTASYTSDGVKGLLKVGGSNRKQVIEKMIGEMGGKLELFYYAFSKHDVYAIADFPDGATAAALSFAINASGMVTTSSTLLLTPAEADEAAKKAVHYTPPGS